MLNFIKDFLAYSKSERNGTIILLFIVFILILVPKILPYFQKEETYDFSQFKKEILDFEKQVKKAELAEKKDPGYELFQFNPNGLPEEDWKKLGIDERIISIIKNYEEKGGKFYKKEDLKKIYGFKEKDYQRLEPYIAIPPPASKYKKTRITRDDKKENWPKDKTYTYKRPEKVIVELNTADSIGLRRLRGIGAVLSGRIIKYRDLLGGFVHIEQLQEVYGIDSALFYSLKDQLLVDTLFRKRIEINGATYQELVAHPYIDYNTAKAIVNYRAQHGLFEKLADLKKIYMIDDKLYTKLLPYLEVQQPTEISKSN